MISKVIMSSTIMRRYCLGLLVVLSLSVAVSSFHRLFFQTGTHPRLLLTAAWEPGKIEDSQRLGAIATAIRERIPASSCFELPVLPPILHQNLKYRLYPVRVADAEPNRLNALAPCRPEFKLRRTAEVGSGEAAVPISEHAYLVKVSDTDFVPASATPKNGRALPAVRFLIFQLLVFGTGLAVLGLVLPDLKELPLGFKVGCGYLAGLVCVTFPVLAGFLSGLRLSEMFVYMVIGGAFAASYLALRLKGRGFRSLFSRPVVKKNVLVWDCFAFLIVGVFTLTILAAPIGIIDEVHIWILKAKIFHDQRVPNLDYLEYTNTYYPLLWPVHIAMQGVFSGTFIDYFAKYTSAAIFLSLLLLIKSAVMILGGDRRFSWVAVIAFLICFHNYTFFTALPENLFTALLMAAAVSMLFKSRDGSAGTMTLAGIFLTGLAAVKFEGVVAALVFYGALLMTGLGKSDQGRMSPGRAAAWFMMPALVHALWICWLNAQSITYVIYHMQSGLSFVNLVHLFDIFARFLKIESLLATIILIIGSALFFWRRQQSPEIRFLFLLAAGLIGFASAAGLRWPASDFVAYYTEVFFRLATRAMPFFTVWWIVHILPAKR